MPLERCIAELQAYERSIEPNRVDPDAIAASYRQRLVTQCHGCAGRIFVAELRGEVVGFVCVLAHVSSEDPIEKDPEHAYIPDLVVMPEHRGAGVGRALLAAAETYAVSEGARVLEVDVLAANTIARKLYATLGFREAEIRLSKEI